MAKEEIKKYKEKCAECKEPGKITAHPTRCFASPNKGPLLTFCSKACVNKYNKEVTEFFIDLDRNASDSECFEHDHWEGGMRVGKCKITGAEVKVEPLCPGDNSGQPKECYDHFEPRKK